MGATAFKSNWITGNLQVVAGVMTHNFSCLITQPATREKNTKKIFQDGQQCVFLEPGWASFFPELHPWSRSFAILRAWVEQSLLLCVILVDFGPHFFLKLGPRVWIHSIYICISIWYYNILIDILYVCSFWVIHTCVALAGLVSALGSIVRASFLWSRDGLRIVALVAGLSPERLHQRQLNTFVRVSIHFRQSSSFLQSTWESVCYKILYDFSCSKNKSFVFLWKRPDPKISYQLLHISQPDMCCTLGLYRSSPTRIRLPDSYGSRIFSISPTLACALGAHSVA